jgi:predicted cytidylate kinase
MIVTISGKPGSGKTTLCSALSAKLNLKHYNMGAVRRKLAGEKGLTINQLNKLAESDPSSDRLVDDQLLKLGKQEDNFIAEGRTAAHFIPNSIKVFLDVDINTGAERIRNDIKEKGIQERNEQVASTTEEQVTLLKTRMESDKIRYKQYYNIDIFDKGMYDLWIDTTDLTKPEVLENVLGFISRQSKI